MKTNLFVFGLIVLLLGIILCIFGYYFGILFAVCSYFIVYCSFTDNKKTVKKKYTKTEMIKKAELDLIRKNLEKEKAELLDEEENEEIEEIIEEKEEIKEKNDLLDSLELSLDDITDKSRYQYEKYVKVRFLGYNKVYTYLSNPQKKLKTGDYVAVLSNGEEKIVYVVEGDKEEIKKSDMNYKMIQFPEIIYPNNNYNLYNNLRV